MPMVRQSRLEPPPNPPNKQHNTKIMSETTTLEFKWTVSRDRDTYGYNICTLYANGRKVARCNGGGYDMQGTCFGDWIARTFADRLLALQPEQMPEQSHYDYEKKERVSDGRSFYGLTFHNPNYDPSKAVIGQDCTDRTLTKDDAGSEGKTVEQAEKDGNSFGLERYQAFYQASSKTPTKLHRVPLIDGACGFSSVEQIAKAIGITLEYVACRSKNLSIYRAIDNYNTTKVTP